MSSVLTPGFILRTLAGVTLALVASIAWGLWHTVIALTVVCAVSGWGFSLANALLAALLWHYSQRPGISIAIGAVTLVFYPLIQYHLAVNSSDGVALELARIFIVAYLMSGATILGAMSSAAGGAASGADSP